MSKPDPLEGFQITDYDDKAQKVTIELHPYLLRNPKSREALFKKITEIIEDGPNVRSVDWPAAGFTDTILS